MIKVFLMLIPAALLLTSEAWTQGHKRKVAALGQEEDSVTLDSQASHGASNQNRSPRKKLKGDDDNKGKTSQTVHVYVDGAAAASASTEADSADAEDAEMGADQADSIGIDARGRPFSVMHKNDENAVPTSGSLGPAKVRDVPGVGVRVSFGSKLGSPAASAVPSGSVLAVASPRAPLSKSRKPVARDAVPSKEDLKAGDGQKKAVTSHTSGQGK